mmetsp:Transcript_54155/g.150278  ORF Transcript_54155/g.150278 Transcript_54155/m.150278 type:complete len:110 (-) Transcript_54155:234-563(-)|eukprot:CAMPEP_0179121110 /NCGR_PEP_ID=MMETSP0796-20121207/57097_1 /TAXON_ID=73915 /ORGANISM="Pyrodinium bahamense, Strain pbaha01" /LENGTH=109 /DNA_ID=CAMNT_0020819683 /DNA_START=77 /DNA_END=406 /DNA_ORIENTATION=-
MGAKTSTCCSMSDPAGFAQPIPVVAAESLGEDRIDQWSRDMGGWAECSQLTTVVTCGRITDPPSDYLADAPSGSIVLRHWSSDGPYWGEDLDKGGSRVKGDAMTTAIVQ